MWRIESQQQPAANKNKANKSTYIATQEKKHPGSKQQHADDLLCQEWKITDLALVFFTLCLVVVGWFTLRSADENTKRKERAYMVAAGIYGIPKHGIDPWAREHRAKAIMFKGPWRMAIRNFGQTAGFTTLVEWGLCPKERFPKDTSGKYRLVSDVLDDDQFDGFRAEHMKDEKGRLRRIDVQDIFGPSKQPDQYRHVELTDEERKVDWIFFGRIRYKDVFRDPHFSTFCLLINDNHTEGLGIAYSDDHN